MITPAFAQTTSPIAGGAIDFLIPMIPVFAIFYFLVIRPQQKRMKEHQALIDAVKRGDTVVTTGGIIGKVIRVGPEGELRVEIANNVQIQIVKSAISEVRSKSEPVRETEEKSPPPAKGAKPAKGKAEPAAAPAKPGDDESGKQPAA
jgi:preprotein translocase subunit YajC